MPEWLKREGARHTVTWNALDPAFPTPRICHSDSALDHRPIGPEMLASSDQAKLIETAESSQIGRSEGSVRQVEVFQIGSVRTPIFGGPRPLPDQRRAPAHYTLVCEEPN